MTDSGNYFLTRGHLSAFTEALTHALYDRIVEDQRRIHYYYDADVAVWMVLGLHGGQLEERDPKADLMRALLSSGFLGKVHILRPHALELHDVIRRQSIRPYRSDEKFRKRVEEYFKSGSVLEQIAQLRATLSASKSDEERLTRFLEAMREMGTETFIAFEMAWGNWEQRLTRLHANVLQFEQFGEDVRDILSSPEVWQFNRAIAIAREEHYRETSRQSEKPTSINTLTDAVALTTLYRLVARSKDDATQPEVRFHTNTRPLYSAVEHNEDLFALLSYELQSEWDIERSWKAGVVFRSTDYYILRASFDALRFSGLKPRQDSDAVTLPDLQRLANQLSDALRDKRHDPRRADEQLIVEAEGLRLGGRSLRDVLVEIERASFLARLLQDYETPESLRRLLSNSLGVDIFKAVDVGDASAQLNEEAHKLTNDLRRELSSFQEWLDLARDIRRRVHKLAATPADFAITRAERDLGIVRWGGVVHASDLDRAVRYIHDLFSGDESRTTTAAAELAIDTDRPGTESRALALGAVLWTLGQFERVARMLVMYENSHRIMPLSLQLMRMAARLRAGEERSQQEKVRELRKLMGHVNTIKDPAARARVLIGLAYVAYYVAYSEGDDALPARERASDPFIAEWAQASFDYASDAVRFLPPRDLRYAFAVNHCAYVGVAFDLAAERTAECVGKLKSFRGDNDLWHYRFADTIAMIEYQQAHRLWAEMAASRDAVEKQRLQTAACDHLLQADILLKSAKPYFGDPEIPLHVREIRRLQQQVGCNISAAEGTAE